LVEVTVFGASAFTHGHICISLRRFQEFRGVIEWLAQCVSQGQQRQISKSKLRFIFRSYESWKATSERTAPRRHI
jgi:hypothetical protein